MKPNEFKLSDNIIEHDEYGQIGDRHLDVEYVEEFVERVKIKINKHINPIGKDKMLFENILKEIDKLAGDLK